jgi:Cu(I)/Ag(I) efflux system membrane fusion protein
MARTKWLGWLIALAVVAAVGMYAWSAHARGWLAPAYHWIHHLFRGGEGGGTGGSGMAMDMPGMGTGPMAAGHGGASSGVPGHAVVVIPPDLEQRIGVTVGRVEKAPLTMSVRTVGIVRPNETKVARVHLKTEGWVEKLFVNYTGQTVQKGDPLLAIYSPQFLATQQEYLTARQAGQLSLAESARQRLELWGVPAGALDELGRTGKPRRNLALDSPITGAVLEKNVLEQEYVTPQKELYVIADLSTVWVQAKVYEYELPHVELGQPADVTLPSLPGRTLTGTVVFVQPTVQEPTRTAQVRVELPNPDGRLKPGMFANVEIHHTMGEGLLVPTAAVIRTGERDIAFRAEPAKATGHGEMKGMGGMGAGERFVPVEVTVSPFQYGGRFHVLAGLTAGDRVVTSANFLIDSESRLRLGGMGGMPGMPGMDMGDKKGKDMKGTDHSKMKH